MAGAVPEPEDFKTFIREITRRHESATDAMIRRSDATQAAMKVHFDSQAAATREQTARLRDHTGALREMRTGLRGMRTGLHEVRTELREMRTEPRADRRVVFEEMRAKRAALFAMSEVLEGGDPGAGA
jgi:hypothetical protein